MIRGERTEEGMTVKWPKQYSVALVHGIPTVIGLMERLTRQACPGVRVFNLLNEGLFLELCQAGQMTPSIRHRLCQVIASAEETGASAILVTGSTLCPAVDSARKLVSVPVLKIDEAMAEEAVKKGRRIGLVATEEATITPSSETLKLKAAEAGAKIEVLAEVCPEARVLLREGNVDAHDRLIAEKVKVLEGKVDVIVLAQASMYSAQAKIKQWCTTPPPNSAPDNR